MSDHNAHLAKETWDRQNPLLTELYRVGAADYMKGVSAISKAFELKDHCVRCMDEGTPTGIHLAGSGILLSEEKAEEALKMADCDGVYSHAECGAAGIYAKNNGLDSGKSDEYGIEWAKKIAEKIGVPYKGHIDVSQMNRPSGLHVARVAYYDGTGRFDYSVDEKLPPGFIIGRKYVDKDYALAEAKVATSIATGGHGFGELINSEAPFLIIVIGDPNNASMSVDVLKDELNVLVAENGGKVKVDGFTAEF